MGGCSEAFDEVRSKLSSMLEAKDSEDFIYKIFTQPCFKDFNYENLDTTISIYLKCGDSFENKKMDMSKEQYTKMYTDILLCKYRSEGEGSKYKEISDISKEKDEELYLLRQIFYKLFDTFDINPSSNCLIFRIILLPILLTRKLEESEKNEKNEKNALGDTFKVLAEHLFRALQITDFTNEKKLQKREKDEMMYTSFCESFVCFLSLILCGITKAVYEVLDEEKMHDNVKQELYENLTNYFTPKNIKAFYIKIANGLIEDIKGVKTYIDIKDLVVDTEKFTKFCFNNNIMNYFKLRKDFLENAKNNK